MPAYLITGNPGSGKSSLAAELRRRGLAALDTDDMAFWADDASMPVDPPADAGDQWRLAHRWIWSRARVGQSVSCPAADAGSVFCCGIARNQADMFDLFEKVFLLMIDEGTQLARLSRSPNRTEAIKKQVTDGRLAFQSQMLALRAIPLDATMRPRLIADILVTHLGLHLG